MRELRISLRVSHYIYFEGREDLPRMNSYQRTEDGQTLCLGEQSRRSNWEEKRR